MSRLYIIKDTQWPGNDPGNLEKDGCIRTNIKLKK